MARRYEEPAPMGLAEDDACHALLETSRGVIRIRLRPDLAPQSVNSFVFLAREGFYDGSTFHRVIPGFIAQGGDPTGRGHGGPGYRLGDELSDEPFAAGAVGLANSGPDSNGSQFFIALADAPQLTGRFTYLGSVEDGLDAACALTPRDPAAEGELPAGDVLHSVEIVESAAGASAEDA